MRPVYKGKGKSKTAANSFRPVAILTAMSKVLEKCAFETMTDYLERILPAGQYGFRRGRSTTAAIADAHGKWSSIRADGKILGVISIDLTAAFETLDASLLCSKLSRIGICGRAKKWIRDYLSERKQCVGIGTAKSPYMSVKHGVPQGSLLGPLLFLAMVADLPQETDLVDIPSRGYVTYADDICAWTSGNSVESVKEDLVKIAAKVSKYAAKNYLSLSAEKTQVLWSGLPSGVEGPAIDVSGVLVAPLQSIELLGTKFDKNLGSAPFVNMQYKAAAPIVATVKRLARYLPQTHLAGVASALLAGKLTYASWATLTPRLTEDEAVVTATQKLQVCINNAARVVLNISKADKIHTATLLAKTGLPSLNRLLVKSIAIECWRALNMCTPLGNVICGGRKPCRPTRMGSSGKLNPPFKFPRASMAWHAVRLWNLHEELRSAPNLNCAKRVAERIASTCPL